MDFGDNDNSNNNEMWEWPGEEYSLQTDSRNDFSHFLWDEVNTNEDGLFYMLEEQTPIKDCADFGHQVSDIGDNTNKDLEETRESSQLKRRRMLQFTMDSNEADIADVQDAATFLKSKVRECSMVEDGLSESIQWNSDERCALSCEGLDQSSEGWLMECLNENEMRCGPDEMNNYVAYNEQVIVSECNNISPEMETDVVQETPVPAPSRIFKGRKSYMKTPTKLTTSVAYPFSLIKPCGVQGDVTLSDINQRILAPPPSRLKHKKDEDPTIAYPTSAYSGKPVVIKTKIRTEGGKGSITITRTRG
ncbi:protein XRI1 isoform X2 [Elaeis guineensis]|uniref:Protein XRI1 isoform X2 n=1 Tax=Elaeis guineensis var. tenera TaxID=51953 RepID=A0A6I9RHB9_ELAGV|nr:protein XRI1 isoform X2 [Elaeis guineensis]